MNIEIFGNFNDALEYSKSIPETERETVRAYLYNKWYKPEIIGEVDILTGASPLFLLIVNTLETRGRSDEISCGIALDYLLYLSRNNKQYFEKIGIDDCEPYLHESQHIVKLVPALSYIALGKHFQYLQESKNNPDIKIEQALWQIVYLIVHAIYHKDARFAGTWYQTAIGFCDNSVLEDSLTTYVPGLSFYDRGVRHDKLCPVSGTSDPDFWYIDTNGTKAPAEFKQAIKTVEALARYSYNTPSYIYNAKFLFTYGRTNTGALGFYKIDYTCSPYTIKAVEVDNQLIEIIKAVGDKVNENTKQMQLL